MDTQKVDMFIMSNGKYFESHKMLMLRSRLLDVDDIGKSILKPSLEGNFRGSVVKKLEKPEREAIKSTPRFFRNP